MANLPYNSRALIWMGSSRKDLSALPADVRRTFGYGLRLVQNGETPDFAKPLTGFGSGVMELRSDFDSDTYRAVYVAKLGSSIYVLDVFRKKSTRGRNLPKAHRIRIETRLRDARKLEGTTR